MSDITTEMLAEAPSDGIEFAQWLGRAMGRQPTTQELAKALAAAAEARAGKKHRPAKEQPRKRKKAEQDITSEIMGDPLMKVLGEIAIAIIFGTGNAQAAAREQEDYIYLRHLRRNERQARYGDTLYPQAIRHLCHSYGKPVRQFDGFTAWEIIDRANPKMGQVLRGIRSDDWIELRNRRETIANTTPNQLLSLFPNSSQPTQAPKLIEAEEPKKRGAYRPKGGTNAGR